MTYRVKLWDGLGDALERGSFDVIHTYDYAQPHSAVAIKAAKKSKSRSASSTCIPGSPESGASSSR